MITASNLMESEGCAFDIPVDIGYYDDQRLENVQLWVVLWGTTNCEGKWSITLNADRSKNYQILMKFSEPDEAVHFKLASGQLYKEPLY